MTLKTTLLSLVTAALLIAHQASAQTSTKPTPQSRPSAQSAPPPGSAQTSPNSPGALAETLLRQDSLLFDIAFHTCAINDLPKILTKDFVFYHDGSYTNPTADQDYKNFEDNLKSSCQPNGDNKMRREIQKGSLQVFPLNAHEATQTGIQRFYLLEKGQKEKIVEESKFSRTWRLENGQWKLARELDYEVKTQFPDDTSPVQQFQPTPYVPVSKELYDTVAYMDSIYFDTYNTCNLEKMASLMADTMEFYHDKGGLMTSKKDFIEAIQHNICGKVNRRLVPGSLEVYPIHDYGAVLIGYHQFFNHAEPANGWSKPDKYIAIWRHQNGKWQLTRVVSLH
jgi:Domain of unknown function (DUF4440)